MILHIAPSVIMKMDKLGIKVYILIYIAYICTKNLYHKCLYFFKKMYRGDYECSKCLLSFKKKVTCKHVESVNAIPFADFARVFLH